EDVADAEDDLLRIPTWQVGPADATLEQRVTRKAVQPEEKADGSLGVARRVQNSEANILERKGRIAGQPGVDGERPEAGGHEGHLAEPVPVEDGEVIRVHGHRRTGFLMQGGHTPDMGEVPWGHRDPLQRQPLLPKLLQHAVGLQPRVDGDRGRSVAPPDQVAVLTEEIVGKDRDRELFAQRLSRRHPTPISQEADVSTSGSASVMSTISSRRTPPQPGM